jgi:ATP-dependent RNA helicase DeaD
VKSANLTVDSVEQFRLEVKTADKPEALLNVLREERPDQAIVFTRTKIRAEQLFKTMRDKGMNVKALHGDMSQGQRDGVMLSFKGGRVPILVATDVAARGLDISTVTHIVNFDVPTSPDVYVHRIGRTGRVGRSGRAITLVTPKQRKEIAVIEKHAKTEMTEYGAQGPAAPQPKPERETRRPRHTKPSNGTSGPRVKLIISAGKAAGVEPKDVVAAIVDQTHLENDDVRNVRVLERFTLVEVPKARADEVATNLKWKAEVAQR